MDRLVPWVLFGLMLPGCGFGGEDGTANDASTAVGDTANADDDDDDDDDDDSDDDDDDDDDSNDDDDDDDASDDDDDDGEMGCCVRHEAPGCNEPEVEICVCEADQACCTFEWDDNCVDAARNDCDATCEAADDGADDLPGTDDVGDGTDEGTDGPPGTDDVGDMGDVMDEGGMTDVCCEPSKQPGCEDAMLEMCVCGNDPFCCDMEWDFQCTLGANECGAGCAGGGGTGCCTPHASTGCDDMMVESCVCDFDPFCCNQAWDEQCVDEAATQCMAGC